MRSPAPAPILLFSGNGTSPNDVKAVEAVLRNMRIEYAKANSRQLSSMGGLQMQQYRLLIIPGGNFIQIGNGITDGAKDNIRRAVHDGLNYLGICAGAFIAGGLPRGLNLTSDVKFGFYSAEARGIRKTGQKAAGFRRLVQIEGEDCRRLATL